ncbi:GAF domain-containing protein [Rubellimicrobium rubrum]|uniref:GAF domain-containing protein n=1 Tax=Rubellimicrobium rubrum TaxID=2585369 RepID=A0A5C4MYI4_9RHOB|nr:GAF domain-containing protein [Rubellimicrobium rubrum]TNC49550.1 GAF domain-containing protein [Rubellimicrobium rubrum]
MCSPRPPPPELEEICRRAQGRFGVAMALVTIVTQDRQIVKARAGTDLQETSRPDAFCDHLIRSDEVLVVPDTRLDPRFAANPLVTGEPFVRFYAGAPLIYMRDIRLGGLCVLDTRPRGFTPDQKAALAEMADEVMVCILEQELDRFSDALRG